jgi:hypothetical protein
MNQRWVNRILLLCFVLICVWFSSPQGAVPQTSSQAAGPVYSSGPITDYAAAQPDTTDVLRFRRGAKYNIDNPALSELGEESMQTVLDLPPTHFAKEALPFSKSDAVVVASVVSGQAFLSNDRRDIYSEYKGRVVEVLKNSEVHYLKPDDLLDFQSKGGVIRLPSGKLITRGALTDSMPQIGGRYLLFLRFDPNTEDYEVLMAYQFFAGRVYRLDGVGDSADKPKTVARPLHLETENESKFLTHVKSAFASKEVK